MNTGDLGVNGDRLFERVMALGGTPRCYDVGVRAGVSSEIMLEAGGDVWGVDVNECPPQLRDHPHYTFFRGDSVTWLEERWRNGQQIDCAVVDTLHIAEQVMCETYFLWSMLRVGGFLSHHDTCWADWKHDVYLGRVWDRPEVGIMRMFAGRPEVKIETFPESHGMTFVTKLADFDLRGSLDWRPAFEARNLLLALIPPGVENREIWP